MSPSNLVLGLIDSPVQLLVVAIIGLLVFGKRLPEVAKSLGQSLAEFKKGLADHGDDSHKALSGEQAAILPPAEKKIDPADRQAAPSDSGDRSAA